MPIFFPQILSGGTAQFPIRKRIIGRTVRNVLPDGSVIRWPDEGGRRTEWELNYRELSAPEAGRLETFFESVQGRLRFFTFVDPTDNMFRFSEELASHPWIPEGGLGVTEGTSSPLAGLKSYRVSNSTWAPASLTQVVEADPAGLYCLSFWVRGAGDVAATFDSQSPVFHRATAEWKRVTKSFQRTTSQSTVLAGISCGPGNVEVFGLQLEPQVSASGYKPTGSRAGVYRQARLLHDSLQSVASGPDRYACRVRIGAFE